ncbi:sperm-associated antigen 5 [Spea bombifrons]|uniref:sperm-associated antigen 5 n=1 Tax=Spea bombifrons TaxID=233779 RepID=UPI00234AC5AB|nr:sperm-associated antigen 5 [Spea bombifrons]
MEPKKGDDVTLKMESHDNRREIKNSLHHGGSDECHDSAARNLINIDVAKTSQLGEDDESCNVLGKDLSTEFLDGKDNVEVSECSDLDTSSKFSDDLHGSCNILSKNSTYFEGRGIMGEVIPTNVCLPATSTVDCVAIKETEFTAELDKVLNALADHTYNVDELLDVTGDLIVELASRPASPNLVSNPSLNQKKCDSPATKDEPNKVYLQKSTDDILLSKEWDIRAPDETLPDHTLVCLQPDFSQNVTLSDKHEYALQDVTVTAQHTAGNNSSQAFNDLDPDLSKASLEDFAVTNVNAGQSFPSDACFDGLPTEASILQEVELLANADDGTVVKETANGCISLVEGDNPDSISSKEVKCFKGVAERFVHDGISVLSAETLTPEERLLSEMSILPKEDLLDNTGNETCVNETDSLSLVKDQLPDAVLSEEGKSLKEVTAHNLDHDYISVVTSVVEALTPLLSLNNIRQRSLGTNYGSQNMRDVSSAKSGFSSPILKPQLKALNAPVLSREKNREDRDSVGTCITPISTSTDTTWTTPIMLLNKSINTSWEFIAKGEKSARDNASETDSLFWNFSRDSLSDASREELMDRLEGALIVIEVLSRQLQGWQQDLGCSRPSEQRECSTQTCVTYTSADEKYYHNLYIKTMERLQSMRRSHQEEQQLKQVLGEAMQTLESHKSQSTSVIEFAERMYDVTQKDKIYLHQTVSHARELLSDHMALLNKMKEKMQSSMLQRDEMKKRMENALWAKEAMDQCLKDLEGHSSKVIAQLQRDLEAEKRLGEAVQQAYKQQHSYSVDLGDFVFMAQSVCSQMEEDRNKLQLQCSNARQLISQHWQMFEVMKERTQNSVQNYDTLKGERDAAYQENEELCIQLNDMKSKNDHLKSENAHLSAELTSLMEHLCKLESEIDQLKQENSDLSEELSAKESSCKLLESELCEANARGVEIQDENRELTNTTVPRLELEVSEAVQQNNALQMQLQDLVRQHASQIAMYMESIEFLEQENSVCREQVSETESQLKNNLFALRERNLQCETQKDIINKLQSELQELQDQLSSTKIADQDLLLKMGKDLSESSVEVSKLKETVQELTRSIKEALQGEQADSSSVPHTPGPGSVFAPDSLEESLLRAQIDEHIAGETINPPCLVSDSEPRKTGSIWSKTSAFTLVQPLGSPSAGESEESLLDLLHELNDSVSDFTASSSKLLEAKQQIIKDLKQEIFALKEDLQSTQFQDRSDIRNLKEEIEILGRKNQNLNEMLNSKQQCIRELEGIVHQQEQKILQQLSREREREEICEENSQLKRSLQLCENEVRLLKDELAKNRTDAGMEWIQEKLLLHKDLTKLRLMLVETENSKSEIVHRALRHRDILEGNLKRSEAELKKLDDIIERIRETLLRIPEVVSSCKELRQVMGYLE